MRAFTWVSLGCLALACGGTAFSTSDGSNGGTSADGASSGVLNRAGSDSGGSQSTGGTTSGGTDTGGTDVVGGADAGGASSGGTDVGGTNTGGTDVGGTSGSGGSSGGVSSGGSGMTGGSTTGGSGGGTAIDIVCPKNQPSVGHPCKDGLVCSYGLDIRTECRNIATCSSGVWTVDKPNCPSLNNCDNIQPGDMCDASVAKPCQLDGQPKQYCICSACSGGVCMVDGATWQCAGVVGANCPELAPNEGQACVGSRECDYGSCNTGDPVAAVCSDAVWGWHYTAMCPL